MLRFISNPWILGIVAFFAMRWTLGEVFDLSPLCNDGWRSTSIGKRGACSYHGGVDRSAMALANIVGLVAGVIVGVLTQTVWKRSSNSGKNTHNTSNCQKPECPSERVTSRNRGSDYLKKHSTIVEMSIKEIGTETRVEILGDCIKCNTRFSWRGRRILCELEDFLQYSITDLRGKLVCPDCNTPLQLTFTDDVNENLASPEKC